MKRLLANMCSCAGRAPAFLSMALPLLLGGCITQNLMISVKPDGSGYLAVTRILPPQMVMQYEQYHQTLSADGGDVSSIYHGEESLRKGARIFGSGVHLVGSRAIDRAGAKGVAALYSFENINNLKINPNALAALLSIMQSEMVDEVDLDDILHSHLGGDDVQFDFTREDSSARLRIMLPSSMYLAAREVAETGDEPGIEPGDDDQDDEDEAFEELNMFTMAHMMDNPGLFAFPSPDRHSPFGDFSGVQLSLTVEVQGEVEESTSSLPVEGHPNRVLIYDIDFDKLGGTKLTEDVFESMSSPTDMLSFLYSLPGAAVETNREVVILFK
jgi:hypothetical protein